MDLKLKRTVIRRLAVAAMVLAVVAGAIAFVLEIRELDAHVASLALEESRGMMDHVAFLGLTDADDFDRVRRQVEAHLIEDHIDGGRFIIIDLYDRRLHKVITVSNPEFRHIEHVLDERGHGIPPASQQESRRFSVAGQFFVQVVVPLQYDAGETVGYLEGVYRVEPEIMRKLRLRLLLSVLQVVLVVFVTTLVLYPVIITLNRDTVRLSDDLEAANIGMLEMLGSAVAKRDRETSVHNYRVTLYAIRLAEAARMDQAGIQGLVKGAFLHDVGKIGISDALLHKPSRLSEGEEQVMASHVEHGVDIVGRYEWLKDALPVVQYHHEKFDGTGYRAGLKGRDIPLAARIFTIADVFDALTTKRPYKGPLLLPEALAAMEEERATRFDPELLDLFRSIAPALYREVYLADEERLVWMLDGCRRRYFTDAEGGSRGAAAP